MVSAHEASSIVVCKVNKGKYGCAMRPISNLQHHVFYAHAFAYTQSRLDQASTTPCTAAPSTQSRVRPGLHNKHKLRVSLCKPGRARRMQA